MVLVFPNDDVDDTDHHHQGDEESFIEITLLYIYIVGRMAGIIAQLTRSNRERSLRKNYGANK